MAKNSISGVDTSAVCSRCLSLLWKHASNPFIVRSYAFPRNSLVECLAPCACADFTVFWGHVMSFMVVCRECTEPENRASCSRHWVNASGGSLSSAADKMSQHSKFPCSQQEVRDMQPGVRKKSGRFRCWRLTDFTGRQMWKYFWRSGNFSEAFQEVCDRIKDWS